MSFQAHAQLTVKSGRYSYNKTSRVKGTQTELYDKVDFWVRTNFDKKTTTIKSKEADGELVINSWVKHELDGILGKIYFTYKIEFLGGMYRESFTDFVYKYKGKDLPYENRKVSGKKAIMNETYEMIQLVSTNLGSYVQSELTAKED